MGPAFNRYKSVKRDELIVYHGQETHVFAWFSFRVNEDGSGLFRMSVNEQIDRLDAIMKNHGMNINACFDAYYDASECVSEFAKLKDVIVEAEFNSAVAIRNKDGKFSKTSLDADLENLFKDLGLRNEAPRP